MQMNVSYCDKSHWNEVIRHFLQNSRFSLADFAQNFTNERQNPTNCYHEIILHFYQLVSEI